jgi:hypothetical protein
VAVALHALRRFLAVRGGYQIVVFARGLVTGTFNNARVVRVVIPPQ